MAAATKSNTQIDDWTAVEATALFRGVEANVSTTLNAGLMVTVVHTEAVANALGALVTVQGRFGANDEDWHDLYSLRMGIGTAVTLTLDAEAASGQRVVPMTSPTTNFETVGMRIFIHDGTLANSEVAKISSWVEDVSLTVLDNLANTHANAVPIFSLVDEKFFPLPDSVSTARVLFLNDDADSDLAIRTDLSAMTAIG